MFLSLFWSIGCDFPPFPVVIQPSFATGLGLSRPPDNFYKSKTDLIQSKRNYLGMQEQKEFFST